MEPQVINGVTYIFNKELGSYYPVAASTAPVASQTSSQSASSGEKQVFNRSEVLMIITGNIGNDVKIQKTTKGTSVCHFSVATNHFKFERMITEWHRITCWGKLAENCGKFLKKGDEVTVHSDYVEHKRELNAAGEVVRYFEPEIHAFKVKFPPKKKDVESAYSEPDVPAAPAAKKPAHKPTQKAPLTGVEVEVIRDGKRVKMIQVGNQFFPISSGDSQPEAQEVPPAVYDAPEGYYADSFNPHEGL